MSKIIKKNFVMSVGSSSRIIYKPAIKIIVNKNINFIQYLIDKYIR